MTRVRFSLAAATLVAIASWTALSAAPAMQAPPMKSVLAGRKLTPPARGEVVVEYTNPVRKVVKKGGEDMTVTTFQVKNVGVAPIARLTITQTWFDKNQQVVGGGKGAVEGLLAPGAVETITIESVAKPSFNGDSFNFAHANGTVRPKAVPKFPPAAPAAGAKPAAAPPATKK
jgi:hypothetical protein